MLRYYLTGWLYRKGEEEEKENVCFLVVLLRSRTPAQIWLYVCTKMFTFMMHVNAFFECIFYYLASYRTYTSTSTKASPLLHVNERKVNVRLLIFEVYRI